MTAKRREGRADDTMPSDPALTDALSATVAALGRMSNEDFRAMRAARRHTARTVATLVIVTGLGFAGWRESRMSAPTVLHYATSRGEQRTISLPDGSTARLNGATRIDVIFVGAERRVNLAQGEVYFDVRHNTTRPFVASAGDVRGEVLGTAFDLDRTHGQVELDVFRGAVRFAGERPGSQGVVVRAGWRSRYHNGSIDRPTAFDPTQQDWREGWIDTDGMLLGEVIEALNRGTGPLVQTPEPRLAAIPIGGRFRLNDPEMLLRLIGRSYGFSAVRDGNLIRLRPVTEASKG